MAQSNKRMAELILKRLTGELSEEELAKSGLYSSLLDELQDFKHLAAQVRLFNTFDAKKSWKKFEAAHMFKDGKQSAGKYVKLAAVFIPLIILTWLLLDEDKPVQDIPSEASTAWMQTDRSYPWSVKATNNNRQWILMEKLSTENEVTGILENNIITFNNSDLQTILRQLDPTADYVVEYAGLTKPRKITGALYRTTTIDQFAEYIEMQFGNTVTVKGKRFIVHL